MGMKAMAKKKTYIVVSFLPNRWANRGASEKDIGTAKFALYTIHVDKNHRIAKLKIFLHVKHVTLKAILDILCGQNYLIHIFEGGKIKFVSPIEE